MTERFLTAPTFSVQFFFVCLRTADNNFDCLGLCISLHFSLPIQKKRRLRHRNAARLLLYDWFFCRPPTFSFIWPTAILLHLYRVFLLPANAPAQSPASISDFRCQPHQRDDALCPFSLYAFPVEKSTKRVKKELSTCAVNSFCCIITLFKLRYNIRVKIRRRPTSPLPLLS